MLNEKLRRWTRESLEPLAAIIKDVTGKEVNWSDYAEYMQTVGKITAPDWDLGGLLHELGHWLVATPAERTWPNLFLDEFDSTVDVSTDAGVYSLLEEDTTTVGAWLARINAFDASVRRPTHLKASDEMHDVYDKCYPVTEHREIEVDAILSTLWCMAARRVLAPDCDMYLADHIRSWMEVNASAGLAPSQLKAEQVVMDAYPKVRGILRSLGVRRVRSLVDFMETQLTPELVARNVQRLAATVEHRSLLGYRVVPCRTLLNPPKIDRAVKLKAA